MNADKLFWSVLAQGQKVMAAELLFAARNVRSADEVRQCVDLANKCAQIESSCREMAKKAGATVVGECGTRVCAECGWKFCKCEEFGAGR